MPPRLRPDWFVFKPSEKVPEYIDEFPDLGDRDLSKICIIGFDRRTKLRYAVVTDIDTPEIAKFLLKARERRIKQTQWDNWPWDRDKTTIIEPEY